MTRWHPHQKCSAWKTGCLLSPDCLLHTCTTTQFHGKVDRLPYQPPKSPVRQRKPLFGMDDKGPIPRGRPQRGLPCGRWPGHALIPVYWLPVVRLRVIDAGGGRFSAGWAAIAALLVAAVVGSLWGSLHLVPVLCKPSCMGLVWVM